MLSTVHTLSTRSRLGKAVTAAALVAACVAPGGASAAQHAPDLPLALERCKLDTSPAYPSCGGISEAKVAVRLPDPWFTVEVCKHDTSPAFPSCGGRLP